MLRSFTAGRTGDVAPVLVLVHGMGHWTQASWNRIVPHFAQTHRVVAFDLPGFGSSGKPDASYTLAYFTTALRAVVAAHNLHTFALAGHSLGGMIAANYAAFHPDRVRALALIDPAGFSQTPSLVARVLGASALRRLPIRLRAPRAFVRYQLRHAAYDPDTFGEADMERACELALDPATARAFLGVYAGALHEMLHLRAVHRRFARYTGPVTIVWGRQDNYVPAASLARAMRVYPRASSLLLDRCGHCPQIEFPQLVADRFRANGA